MAKLGGNNDRVNQAALRALAALIPKLDDAPVQKLVAPIFAKLGNYNYLVDKAVFEALTALIRRLDPKSINELTVPILEKLDDHDPLVHRAALKALAQLIPKLEDKSEQKLYDPILEKINDPDPVTRQEVLKVFKLLASKINNLSFLLIKFALCLNSKNLELRRYSFDFISRFMAFTLFAKGWRNFGLYLNELEPSEEVSALQRMWAMQQQIEANPLAVSAKLATHPARLFSIMQSSELIRNELDNSWCVVAAGA